MVRTERARARDPHGARERGVLRAPRRAERGRVRARAREALGLCRDGLAARAPRRPALMVPRDGRRRRRPVAAHQLGELSRHVPDSPGGLAVLRPARDARRRVFVPLYGTEALHASKEGFSFSPSVAAVAGEARARADDGATAAAAATAAPPGGGGRAPAIVCGAARARRVGDHFDRARTRACTACRAGPRSSTRGRTTAVSPAGRRIARTARCCAARAAATTGRR